MPTEKQKAKYKAIQAASKKMVELAKEVERAAADAQAATDQAAADKLSAEPKTAAIATEKADREADQAERSQAAEKAPGDNGELQDHLQVVIELLSGVLPSLAVSQNNGTALPVLSIGISEDGRLIFKI